MSCNRRPSGWWLLALVLLGGAVAWVVRALRDEDVWTDVPAPVPTAPVEVRADVPDDLTRIEGIGPKIGAALAAAGLTTFASVAEATEDELRTALTTAKLRFAPSLPTWSKQARLLADGDEEGFAALTERLVGGREV